ncbi:CCL3 protein, partial [Circaetus pectoralis]|nr:CCL3 protein [Circaetus pectoralis]
MQVPAAALATLLLMAICSPAEAHLADSSVAASSKMTGVPTSCCFSYQQHRIPRSLITSAYMTSSKCIQPAVILVTKNGKMLCADPQAKWVQAYLEYFQMQES